MNILFAANAYVDRGVPKDGFPIYLYRVSHALKELGHTPIIVYCSDRDSFRVEDKIKIYGIKCNIIRSEKSWLSTIFAAFCRSYYLNKKIKVLVEKEKVDLIQFTSLNAISLLYNGKVPTVMRLSSYTKNANPTFDTMDKCTVFWASLLEVFAGKRCNAVFAPSYVTAMAYQRDFKRHTYVIETPYIQDTGVYDYSFYENHLKGKKYALFFGRLYYAKGITVIAEILEKFLKQYKDYYFVFIGDTLPINGKSAANIILDGAGKCKKRVIVLKALEHKILYPIIENSEFIVMPSIMDNLPNTCIESMFLSKIVIGTYGASFEQLIVHRKNGLLCKIGDSEDLLEKMETAANMDVQEKQKMEQRAKESVKRLEPEHTIKKLIKFYEAVVKL